MNKITFAIGLAALALGGCADDDAGAAVEGETTASETATAGSSDVVASEGSDYPGYPGMTVVSENNMTHTGTLIFTTTDSIAQVFDYYRAHAAFKNWPINTDYDYGGDTKAVMQAASERGGVTVNADRKGELTEVKVRHVSDDITYQGE